MTVCRDASRKSKCKGFSLVELIVVFAIIAVTIFYLLFRWPGGTINAAYEANQLANYIRATEQYAMSRATQLRITLTAIGYQIYYSSDITNFTIASDNIIYPTGISMCGCGSYGSGTCYVMFDVNGLPYTANSSGVFSSLTSNFDITLCVSGPLVTKVVRVNQAGGVSVP
ncbi:MAG: type II secretion system GspH family protein [Gammaproteobacteria bacterium]|nr:type II secretion system GspH family protein [Gammaproteobacteria bacterium]